MIFRVRSGSGSPIYLQIESQVRQAAASGALKQDDVLPSVRRLATDLRINPNTVARAYSNLERDGIVRTVPGGGTYILLRDSELLTRNGLLRATSLAIQLVVEGKQLGLSVEQLTTLLKNAATDLEGKA